MIKNNGGRLWRALVCVASVRPESVTFFVPAYGRMAKDYVKILKADLPPEIRKLCEAGPSPGFTERYFHARVNIGADRSEDLRFQDWETS